MATIQRNMSTVLKALFAQYPFVTVTGPRQSGKTTLCRDTFPHLSYANLESPEQRNFASEDPIGFLNSLSNGAIIDEIQRVPELVSYLQVHADEQSQNSLYILTGSERFELTQVISQSLAGRTGILRLLPFTIKEMNRIGASIELNDLLYSGFYPRIHDQSIEPSRALSDYLATYIERDVRRIGGVNDLLDFELFMRLCAGRIGGIVDLVALGRDTGVSHTTARNWLNVLESSYIVFRLPPLRSNLRKRLVKRPKLYFYDVGLAAHLMGIQESKQLVTHPMRGYLFENLVVIEALKYRFNQGKSFNLSFFRDNHGLECDLLYGLSDSMVAIEIKSGATVPSDAFRNLHKVSELLDKVAAKFLVYGGNTTQTRSDAKVIPFNQIENSLEHLPA